MHQYLRAIGFSDKMTRKELDKMLKKMVLENDRNDVVEQSDESAFVEISKKFGSNIGITLCGEVDQDGFHRDYYFPYLEGETVSTKEGVMIEQPGNGNTYSGACEDPRVGVTLIFYLQNAAEYMKESGKEKNDNHPLILSGLAGEGKILLPVLKDKEAVKVEQESAKNRSSMIAAARNGDEEAMENLTMEEMDTYSMISTRIVNEDILSIVDSYFMPYGIQCDQYSILGEILEVHTGSNIVTDEELVQMTIESNNMQFDVCINRKDLLGDPQVGRRFKGTVWLQGKLQF